MLCFLFLNKNEISHLYPRKFQTYTSWLSPLTAASPILSRNQHMNVFLVNHRRGWLSSFVGRIIWAGMGQIFLGKEGSASVSILLLEKWLGHPAFYITPKNARRIGSLVMEEDPRQMADSSRPFPIGGTRRPAHARVPSTVTALAIRVLLPSPRGRVCLLMLSWTKIINNSPLDSWQQSVWLSWQQPKDFICLKKKVSKNVAIFFMNVEFLTATVCVWVRGEWVEKNIS